MDDERGHRLARATLRRMREPMLRPGARLLRRDATTLQVGLDPRYALAVADTVEHRDLLTRWLRGDARDLLRTHPLAVRLRAAGLVVDSPTRAVDPDDPGLHPAAAVAPRPSGRALVCAFGGAPGASLGARARELMSRADLVAVPADDPEASTRDARPGDVGVLVGVGQPSRAALDPWLRTGLPHLVLRADEGAWLLGPAVAPGRTACLRCLDAHRADTDPRWPLLVEQQARAAGVERGDGSGEPVDPALAALALGWLTHDLRTWLAGGRPATWSSTLRLDPDRPGVALRSWPRHPGCGCSWDLGAPALAPGALERSATMEA